MPPEPRPISERAVEFYDNYRQDGYFVGDEDDYQEYEMAQHAVNLMQSHPWIRRAVVREHQAEQMRDLDRIWMEELRNPRRPPPAPLPSVEPVFRSARLAPQARSQRVTQEEIHELERLALYRNEYLATLMRRYPDFIEHVQNVLLAIVDIGNTSGSWQRTRDIVSQHGLTDLPLQFQNAIHGIIEAEARHEEALALYQPPPPPPPDPDWLMDLSPEADEAAALRSPTPPRPSRRLRRRRYY